jgi:hypothetical protein
MPDVTKEYIKSQKPWIKIAMKGRPLWFGMQSQGLEGLFRISKKKGEVTKQKLFEGKPFDESSKGGKEANTDGIGTKAVMGVCQKGAAGRLKLLVVKGSLTEGHLKFARIFISRTMKVKSVKEVIVSEVADESQLPKVDEDAKTPEEATSGSVAKRVEGLKKRLTALGGNPALVGEVDAAGRLAQTNPEEADEALDEVEEKIIELEAKGKGGAAPLNGKLVSAIKSWSTASSAVDKQLGDIKAAMLKEKDDAIRDIANSGLADVDGGFRNKLNAALKELAAAGDDGARKKASTAAQAAMKDLLKHVGGDERIKVLADPPNGWPKCTIKETMNPALKELAVALQ